MVTKVEGTNPHVRLYVNVKDETGKVTNSGVEVGLTGLECREPRRDSRPYERYRTRRNTKARPPESRARECGSFRSS
jgi:hypothetical protein